MSKLKYIIGAVLAILLVVTVTAVTYKPSEKIRLRDSDIPAFSAEYDKKIFVSDGKTKNMKKVASSGVLEMYLDEKTLAVCVLARVSLRLWSVISRIV